MTVRRFSALLYFWPNISTPCCTEPFYVLLGLRVQDMKLASTLITCAVILHNLAIRYGDNGEDFEPVPVLPGQPEINVPENHAQAGPVRERRRNEILNFFLLPRLLRQREE